MDQITQSARAKRNPVEAADKISAGATDQAVLRGAKRRQRTRAAIIDAAREVMEQQGFAATTIEAIITKAGVARASYYAHFQDKADVVRAIVAQMWERSEDMYVRFGALKRVAHADVRAWLQVVSDTWSQHYNEVLTLIRDLHGEMAVDATTHMARFVSHLVRNERLWACSRTVAECRAHLLIGQLERAMLDLHRGGWIVDEQMLLEELASIWVDALTRP